MGMSGHASGDSVVAGVVSTTVLAGIAVISRLFTRIGLQNGAGLHDIFITLAMIFSLALTICICLQVKYGMGQRGDTLSEEDHKSQLKPFWASLWTYYLALAMTKISILIQYLRIFPQTGIRRACYIMIAIVALYGAWTFFSAVFMCFPVEAFWEDDLSGARCLDRFAVWFSNAAINIAMDVAVCVLPLPALNSLQLPKRQKVIVMCVFALGGFTCLMSALRLQSLYAISKADDVSYENPLAAVWSSVETNTGIICSCIPTLKACVSRVFPRLFNSSHAYAISGRQSNKDRTGAGGNTRTNQNAQRSNMSFDALGRGLTGRGQPTQQTYIHSRMDGSSEDIDMDAMRRSSPTNEQKTVDDGIQVVTVVEQEVSRLDTRDRRREGSDSGSTKQLMDGTFYEHN